MFRINWRHLQTRHLLCFISKVVADHVPRESERGIMRELEELLHVQGAYIVTEADRIRAGLEPRDHYGMTLEDIRIMEERFRAAMLQPTAMIIPPEEIETDHARPNAVAYTEHPFARKLKDIARDLPNHIQDHEVIWSHPQKITVGELREFAGITREKTGEPTAGLSREDWFLP